MGRGSQQLHTVWVPWCDVPVELGGLVVLEVCARRYSASSALQPPRHYSPLATTALHHYSASSPIAMRCSSHHSNDEVP